MDITLTSQQEHTNTMTENIITEEYPNLYNGKFSVKDWSRIVHALQSYVISEEANLRRQNVGDREWQEVNEYSGLARDIQLYVLPLGDGDER